MRIRAILLASALLPFSLALPGCADRGSNIPPDANKVAEGNDFLSYEAPHDGIIYVYSANSDRLVYSGPIQHGQRIELQPDHDQIVVGDRVVQDKTPNIHDQHRIYFMRQENAAVHTY